MYHNYTEANPLLHAAVASLSAAGVAIGDAVNATDRSVAMRTCGDDGRLLRTARAALAIDASFRAPEANRCPGDVSHTCVCSVRSACVACERRRANVCVRVCVSGCECVRACACVRARVELRAC